MLKLRLHAPAFAGLTTSWMMNDKVRSIVSLCTCIKEVPCQRTLQYSIDNEWWSHERVFYIHVSLH